MITKTVRKTIGLLSRFSCASVSIVSSFLIIINHLLTDTYKSTFQTVDPEGEKVGLYLTLVMDYGDNKRHMPLTIACNGPQTNAAADA